METRSDFQQLLEKMDKIIRSRQEELAELDERLDSSREKLSQKEAKELALIDNESAAIANQQAIDDYIQEQRVTYERQINLFGDQLANLENININLVRENEQLKYERSILRDSNEKLKAKSLLLGENLDEVQRANFDLNIRLAQAEKESQHQQRLLKDTAEQDQVLMNAFNDKLKSLEQTLARKDEEILMLRSENQFTLDSLGIKIDFNDKDDDYNQEPMATRTRASLSSSTLATDGLIDSGNKQRIIEIGKALREKDAQIELLKSQLLEATKELENNINIIEGLTKKSAHIIADEQDEKRLLASSGHVVAGEYMETNEQLISSCKMLESELEAKDKQLHSIETRIRHYEMILPSKIIDLIEELKNANHLNRDSSSSQQTNREQDEKVNLLADSLIKVLDELNSSQRLLDIIEQLKSINASKDAQVRRLVTDLNDLDAKLNFVQQEQQQQQQQQLTGGDVTASQEETRQEAMSGVQLIENQTKDNAQHPRISEKSGVSSPNEPMVVEQGGQATNVGESSSDLPIGQQSQQEQQVQEPETPANCETSGSPQTVGSTLANESNSLAEADLKRKPIEQSIKIASSSTKFIGLTSATRRPPTTATIEGALDLQYRLRQLESENQLLELAMKEILLSIRWSDSQCSTILIDCPSLERLCQLIEARFITTQSMGATGQLYGRLSDIVEPPAGEQNNEVGELIQFITVKAELDILRGQNEQLRADLKSQRRENLELMKNINLDKQPSGHQSDQKPLLDDRHAAVHVEVPSQRDEQPAQEQVVVAKSARDTQEQQQPARIEDGKCRSCSRLSQLTQYFLATISKIEEHVTTSDETFVNRLMALHQLTQRLGKDLMNRDYVISQLNRKCDSLSQQRLIIQTKMNSLENRINVHNQICPLTYYAKTMSSPGGRGSTTATGGVKSPLGAAEFIGSTAGRIGQDESIHSVTIRRDHQLEMRGGKSDQIPLRENKMTITVLTSIIDCLKAMLNFKDERLRRLERLLAEH